MQFHEVTALYYDQVAQHLAGQVRHRVPRPRTPRSLLRQDPADHGYYRQPTSRSSSHGGAVSRWYAGKRSRERLVQDPDAKLVRAPATVNRSTTELLKKLLIRCRDTWGVKFDEWPKWKNHILKEPAERVRELHEGEGEAVMVATRDDYAPAVEFQHATGSRQGSVVTLEWSQDRLRQQDHHPDRQGRQDHHHQDQRGGACRPVAAWSATIRSRVFTYVVVKTRDDRVQGQAVSDHLVGLQDGLVPPWQRRGSTGPSEPAAQPRPAARLCDQALAAGARPETGPEGTGPRRRDHHHALRPCLGGGRSTAGRRAGQGPDAQKRRGKSPKSLPRGDRQFRESPARYGLKSA